MVPDMATNAIATSDSLGAKGSNLARRKGEVIAAGPLRNVTV